jgi:hypothetical protein
MEDLAADRVRHANVPSLVAGVSDHGARTVTASGTAPVTGSSSFRIALANSTDALPEIARLLSDLQHPLTRDDLASEIDAFAA